MLKKLKLKYNFKLTPRKIIQLSYVGIIIISIIILFYLFLFLYNNFYQTITQTEEIMKLREKVIVRTINIDKFNEVIKKIEAKIKPREKKQLNDLFD